MNIFTPQRVLQDTTNDQMEQSPDESQKVKKDVKGRKVTEQLKDNRTRSGLRPRGPGGAKLLIQSSFEEQTPKISSDLPQPPDSANENVWSMVGGSYQGVYSPSHGVIGHPFESYWSEESEQFEPIVTFSKRAVNVASTSTDRDRVSPCFLAKEDR